MQVEAKLKDMFIYYAKKISYRVFTSNHKYTTHGSRALGASLLFYSVFSSLPSIHIRSYASFLLLPVTSICLSWHFVVIIYPLYLATF